MLVGDLLAYIDIFAVVLLLGILTRASTILFVTKQATARVGRLMSSLMREARRRDYRHGREGRARGRKRSTGRPAYGDDDPAIVSGRMGLATQCL